MRPRRSAVPSGRSRNGFALIIVLWFLVLIAAIGAYMVANARSQTALAHNILAATRAEAVADAAVAQSVFNLMEPDDKKRWRLDDTPYVIALPGGQATVRLEDERSKINPNLASDKLLAALFEAVGMDNGRAARLGACIADWVSKGDQARPLGAKKPEYEAAGRKYGPPGMAVENMDELQLVLGMTPEILTAVRPYLTIYTSEAVPSHLETVSAPVYRALDTVSHEWTGRGRCSSCFQCPGATAAAGRPAGERRGPGCRGRCQCRDRDHRSDRPKLRRRNLCSPCRREARFHQPERLCRTGLAARDTRELTEWESRWTR